MKVFVSLDNVSYRCKPKGTEIGKIKHRITQHWKLCDLRELAYRIGEQGTAIIPSHLEGGIGEKNFQEIQMFLLDFDGGITFDEIKARADLYELKMSFAYHTYSSSKETEKFRVAFVFNSVVYDAYLARIIIGMLQKIFPECDKSCKNLDRLFWGGKELIFLDEFAVLTFEPLLQAFYKSIDQGGHFARNAREFSHKYRIEFKNGGLSIFPNSMKETIIGENRVSSIIHNIDENQKTPFFIIEPSKEGLRDITCPKTKYQISLENQGCQLLNDFFAGIDLSHPEKLLLFTNLKFIKGGMKRFFEILKNTDICSYKKWEENLRYTRNYLPMNCSDVCPYFNCCNHERNIINTLKLNRKISVDGENYYSLEECSNGLKDNLEKAFTSSLRGMHLIKAQTALGKTTAYIDLISRHKESKFVIAVPTNLLKVQVYEDLLKHISSIEIFVTPNSNDNPLLPYEIRNEISSYHKRGIHNKTSKIIKAFKKSIADDKAMTYVSKECEKILKGIDALGQEESVRFFL